jgi:transposase
MRSGEVTLSHGEIDRLAVVQALEGGRLKQADAAWQLGVSIRQVKRLLRRYREQGPGGMASRHRGQRPNNAFSPAVREHALQLVRTRYADFGPTLAQEKLTEEHGLRLSRETLRQWLMAAGLWVPKRQPGRRNHPRRPRRPCYGELIQIDGSPHDWFEDRGARCTLIVFIDDATGALMALRLVPAETTQAYMETLGDYLRHHGRPVALYSDRHAIFRNNLPDQADVLTQFGRAVRTLDIQPIHAHTPQAKGRVERANQTLQDRLVKELRLRGIHDLDAANAFLGSYREDFNRRFAVLPQQPENSHRPVLHRADELHQILSIHHQRILTKDLAFRLDNTHDQLQGQGRGYRLRGKPITICAHFDHTLTVLDEGRSLAYRVLQVGEPPAPMTDEKAVHQHVDAAKSQQGTRQAWRPPADHPWKKQRFNPPSPPA